MDTLTSRTEPMNTADAPVPRMAAQRNIKTKRRVLFYLPLFGIIIASLIVGGALGVLLIRQRHRAQEVVVSANGVVINREDFFRRLQSASGNVVMHQMLNEELLLQYAQQRHVYPSVAQVDAEYRKISKASLGQALKFRSPDDLKRELCLNLIEAGLMSKNVTVTPQEVQDYYQAQIDRHNPKSRFYTPETATIAVIVTQTEAEGKAAEHDLTDGMPFATVAKNRSIDNSKQNGGLLTPIPRGQTRGNVVELEAAIFGMKVGQQIGPQKFVNAWWIIRCLDKTTETIKPLDDVMDECRRGALLKKGVPKNARSSADDFNEFKSKAVVVAFWPNYMDAARQK